MGKRQFNTLFFGQLLLEAVMHFANACEEGLTCENCDDFKKEVCAGEGLSGMSVMECMANKAMQSLRIVNVARKEDVCL